MTPQTEKERSLFGKSTSALKLAKDKEIVDKLTNEVTDELGGFPCGNRIVLGIQKGIQAGRKQLAEEIEPKRRWLDFRRWKINPKAKTIRLLIKNKENESSLGEIKWDNGWRQYVFDDGAIKLAEGCLYELFEKIRELRLEKLKLQKETDRK